VKKLVAIFFLFIYGITTVGATIHMHYCMNNLIGWNLSHSKEVKCSNCGMEKNKANSCCKDKHKEIKTDKEHQQAQVAVEYHPLTIVATQVPFLEYQVANNRVEVTVHNNVHAPPLIQQVPICILHCIFRI